jgi:hypothetical protein
MTTDSRLLPRPSLPGDPAGPYAGRMLLILPGTSYPRCRRRSSPEASFH